MLLIAQTITSEYDKLPLKRLHFACGTKRFLLATDLKLEAVLLIVISRIKNVSFKYEGVNFLLFLLY